MIIRAKGKGSMVARAVGGDLECSFSPICFEGARPASSSQRLSLNIGPTEPVGSDAALVCRTEQAVLGEGARWDARRDEFLYVDILKGRVFRHRVSDDGDLIFVRSYLVPGTVGAITPVHEDDGWLLAAGRGFTHLSGNGTLRTVAEVAPPGTRMNDAACDPQGRFWAGTMAEDYHDGGGGLYRLDQLGRVEEVLAGLTIPNGPCWSPDGTTMYLVDSRLRAVHAFAFEGDRGSISEGRVLVSVPEEHGVPDGMTVDLAGDLWLALYRGGRVHRYSPEGELREVLAIPTEQTTCCAFGGPGLRQLYVTTATQGWTDEQRTANPGAGLVYRLATDAVGRTAEPYRPNADWWVGFTE
jgi:sugar lactone lactonase YvrE